MSLAQLFAVVPGNDSDVYEASIVGAIREVFSAILSAPTPLLQTPRSPGNSDIKSLNRSLRDEQVADEVCRSVVASLALTRSQLRLTVRALIRRKFVPKVFLPVETLPARVLMQLQSHSTLQDSLYEIVKKSVGEGAEAPRGASVSMLSERIRGLDVFLAEQIDGGLMCHLTPLEAMFGVFSIGCMAAYVATLKYVSGEAPLVTAFMALTRTLCFGPAGRDKSVNYHHSYAAFVDALSEVDRYELVFDIKAVVTLLADALNLKGPRGSLRWDANLMAALRKKNDLVQAQFAVREDLDFLLRELTAMRRYQEDFRHLQGTKPDNTSTMYAALKAAEEIVARAQVANSIQHELPDHFDDHITACSVRKWANRPCKSGKHDVPLNTDFCGECGEFVDGIVICPICQSPKRKQQDSSKKQLCRGRFNLVPCNFNDEEIKKEFLPPKPINIKHASLRYARLLQRDKERVDGSYRAYTITLLPAVPAETAGSHIKSSAAPVPVTAPFVGLIPGGRPSAVAMLTTSSPSAPSLTPTAALTDFNIGWSAADSVRGDSIAADNSASTRLTSPGAHRLSNDQPGNTTQKGGLQVHRSRQPKLHLL